VATGIPKTSGNGRSTTITLAYPGKENRADILRHHPAKLISLWRHPLADGNRLYYGDNLDILAVLTRDKSVCGQIRLIYIDPPFATEGVFISRKQEHAYHDILSGPEYVESIRRRLIMLHHILAENGSIYVHIDEKMVFHLKLVMDEVFGADNYRNCITRKKCNPKNYTRKTFGNVADYILFYSKTENYVWNKPYEPWTEERAKEYQYIDEKTGRRFMKVPIHAPGTRNGETGKPWRGHLPPTGKHWQYPPSSLDEMDARGEIYWSSSGNPRRKVFLDERPGVGVQDIWLDFRDAHNQNIHITGYPTEKNPDLLRRIIHASSNPGDLVLDCYCGSGTTMVIANELKRPWIGIDNSPQAIKTILHRLVHGTEVMGDFVSATNGKSHDVPQMSLFDSLETADTMAVEQKGIAPITKLEILASATADPPIDDLVGEWNCAAVKADLSAAPACVIDEPSKEAKADIFLGNAEPVLASLIQRFGPYPPNSRTPQFGFVVEAIVGQQLSPKAADSIMRRLRAACGGAHITAKRIMALTLDDLKKVGVSQRKAETIRTFACAVEDNTIHLGSFTKMSDEDILSTLTAVKGIGPWTAEMFLIFALGRQDVFPLHDSALKSVISELYRVDTSKPDILRDISNRWRPFRSVACWYLYRYKNAKHG
jgi:adenine-specific DNA-methyltransferase